MYEAIKKQYPILENKDEFIKTVQAIRVAFNAKHTALKITVGDTVIGGTEKYLRKQKELRVHKLRMAKKRR